ncbi:hypothetical protein [Mycobacterium sp.]|uniref:hypothetical protein n=1 Tax=Mycobacterium sp. TaxID=1785 RepID=UPI003F95AC52
MSRCELCDCILAPATTSNCCRECTLLIRNGAIDAVLWVPVVGFEGRFEVSSEAQVRDARTLRLVPIDHSGRYDRVTLGGRRRYLHDVVMGSFVGAKPIGQLVLHRDDDGHNPRLPNLSFGTYAENHADWRRNQRKETG